MAHLNFRRLAIIVLTFCALMIALVASAQDTIHVKKVFINNQIVSTDSGYVTHVGRHWFVNGKKVKLYRSKKIDLESFKKAVAPPAKK
jgi:hypothetical protein